MENSPLTKTLLFELPAMGGLEPEALVTASEASLQIRLDFVETVPEASFVVAFEGVRAYRITAESHCAGWQVQGAYDRLVEIQQSPWVSELAGSPEMRRPVWPMRHFMIYVGDGGCFEVAAASWSVSAGGPPQARSS